jgi:hypothetical protein
VRFQDAARDARAIVYASIQADPLVKRMATLLAAATHSERVLARAVMNGESTDSGSWRAVFPSLLDRAGSAPRLPTADRRASPSIEGRRDGDGDGDRGGDRDRAEAILAGSLDVASRGEEVRSQVRGAIVEELTEQLLAARVGAELIRRERRILFDGVRAEIHPYDVTVERPGAPEAYDCKWGARGIGLDVVHQLDDARRHAIEEGERLTPVLVIFDARRSCEVRLARLNAPREGLRLVTIETLDRLAGRRPDARAAPAAPAA